MWAKRFIIGFALAAAVAYSAGPAFACPPIKVSSSKACLPQSGGTSTITATIDPAQPDHTILFYVDLGLGYVSPIGGETNAQGIATTTFTAGIPFAGATIRAVDIDQWGWPANTCSIPVCDGIFVDITSPSSGTNIRGYDVSVAVHAWTTGSQDHQSPLQ